jgi:hypothetical protein
LPRSSEPPEWHCRVPALGMFRPLGRRPMRVGDRDVKRRTGV